MPEGPDFGERDLAGRELEAEREPRKFSPGFRSRLILKCSSCGHRTVFEFDRPVVCEKCKHGLKWTCWSCGGEFDTETAEFCSRCRVFVCPHCGCCNCQLYAELAERRRAKRLG